MGPPEGGVGAEEARVARVVVTLMGPPPLRGDVKKRMDFQVKSRFPNLEVRRAMLMMWLVPLGSGPTVSRTIVITVVLLYCGCLSLIPFNSFIEFMNLEFGTTHQVQMC